MTTSLRLYFVAHHETSDHINRDLVVWAHNAPEAIHHWRMHFELPDDADPADLFECRDQPRPGAIAWHHTNGFTLLLQHVAPESP